MPLVQYLTLNSSASHHCAGKLANVVVYLLANTVAVLEGDKLTQTAIMSADKARDAYYAIVRQLNAASI